NVVRSEGATIPFKVERSGVVRDYSVEPYKAKTRGWRRKSVRQVLILPAEIAKIEKVEAKTPAAEAGLMRGDLITGVNGGKIFSPYAVADFIEKNPKSPIT